VWRHADAVAQRLAHDPVAAVHERAEVHGIDRLLARLNGGADTDGDESGRQRAMRASPKGMSGIAAAVPSGSRHFFGSTNA
jgi:hypothetical protein